jgi:hypothetical protein
MLTASQILELVKSGEGYNVDFKRSVPSKVKGNCIKKAICSMVKCGDASEMLVICNPGLPQASRGPGEPSRATSKRLSPERHW